MQTRVVEFFIINSQISYENTDTDQLLHPAVNEHYQKIQTR